SVGVKLKMLSLMIKKDFIPFLYILFVIMLGFGIAFHALLWPNGQYIGSNGKAIQLARLRYPHRNVSSNLLYDREYGLDDMQNVCKRNETSGEAEDSVEKCVESPGNVLVPYVLMVAYIVIVQVLLLNVIVAMFSKTIDMVDSESKSLWLFERYDLNQEFFKRSALPAPLNILLETRNFLMWLLSRLSCCRRRSGRRSLIEVLVQNQRNFVYLFYLFYQSVTLRKLRPKLDGVGLEPEDFSQEGAAMQQQLAEVIRRQEAAANWLDDQGEELRQQRELLEQMTAVLLQPRKKSNVF
uniref:Ion_trans domain-containing protein n=1 Tax=Macrostomum lignano TaxID=282301 RepID=A0A1I8GZW4_9PLAT